MTRIEKKLLAYLVVILLVISILVFLVYRGVQNMAFTGALVNQTLRTDEEITELSSQINEASELASEFYITADLKLLDKYSILKEKLNKQIKSIANLTKNYPNQQKRLEKLSQLSGQNLDLIDLMIRSRQREEFDLVRQLLNGQKRAKLKSELSGIISEMKREEQRIYDEVSTKGSREAHYSAAVAVIGIMVATALLFLTGMSLRREITKQLVGEKKLKERDEELSLVLNSSNAGLWFWDFRSNQTTWSEENYKVFGLKPGECIPSYQLWANCLHPEDRERVERELDTSIKEKQSFNTEHRIVLPSGEIRRILVKGQTEYDDTGTPLKISGINLDVTELRTAEEALYESEERFRQIAENIEAVLWIRNAQSGQLEFISSGTERLWGISSESLMDKTEYWSAFVHTDDREKARKLFQENIITGDLDHEYRIITPDGKQRWVRDRAFLVKDKYGKPRRLVGFTIDTTERKQSEEVKALLLAREQEAREQAEAANRMKDQFLAIVSHELRSPLNAMLGWARVLSSEGVDQATHDHAVHVIEQSAEMQSRLIEDLLDSARIASGKLRIEARPVKLIPVIMSAFDTVYPTAESKGVKIQLELDSDTGLITGDAERLQQIVWNLLSNAVKFTTKGGQVVVSLRNHNQWVRITVKDTGKGIAAEDLPKIFDRFRQAESPTTRRAGGLGLGLSLVKSLVELHKGRITTESEGVGKGATFTIDLPLSSTSSPIPELNRDSREIKGAFAFTPVLEGLNILAVDDEEHARDLIATLLTKYGASVTSVSSSAEAMEALTNNHHGSKFDLIVSDISMPDENGYMLIRRIRQLPPPAGKIPAIALTAYGRPQDRIEALEAGFHMHIPKPVEPAELMMVIASLTGRSINLPVESIEDR